MADYEANLLQGPFPVNLVEIGLSCRTSVLCVAKDSSKVFVAFKLAQEIQRKSLPGHFTLLITENTSDSFTGQFIEAINLQTSLNHCIVTKQSATDNIGIQISSSNHMTSLLDAIAWSRVNLVIINNCHLATIEDHPIRQIVNFIKSHDSVNQPIIVGVTAELPVTSSSQLKSVIADIEFIFGCSCHISSDLVALNRYGEIPQENVIHYSLMHSNEGVSNEINSQFLRIIEYIEKSNQNENSLSESSLSQIKSWFEACSSILRKFGSSAALYNTRIILREVNKMQKKSTSPGVVSVLNYCKDKLNFIQTSFSESLDFCQVTQLVHEILSSLWIVKKTRRNFDNTTNMTTDTFAGNTPFMEFIQKIEGNFKLSPVTVILCLSDSEAAVLNHVLNRISKTHVEFSCIKSAYVSSSNIRQSEIGDDTGEIQSQAILQLMNKGEVNVLVLSCDVENEIYVSACKQLIRFGLPSDYYLYVKVKRLVRAANAEVIFVEEDEDWKENDVSLHKVYKNIEGVLSKHCEPCKFAVKDHNTFWDKLSNKSESKLAIAVINRYCSSFPNDGYGSPHPRCNVKVVEDSDKVQVTSTLQLPCHSPIHWPFQASVILSKDSAKLTVIAEARLESLVSVAMLACKTLQETGELDRQGSKIPLDSYTFMKADKPCLAEVADGCLGTDGSTKRQRAYERKFPSVLTKNLPTANDPAYLYHISLSTSNVSGTSEGLTARYNTANMLGLLSKNRLPKIPKFIIYVKATELTVTLTTHPRPITLTSVQLDQVKRFHSYIHREIMCINSDPENECFLFEPETQTYGVYIVPVITAKVKPKTELENIEIDFNTTEEDEAKSDDNNIERATDYKHIDCLKLKQLNLQDNPDNTLVEAENDIQSNGFSGDSEKGSCRQTECYLCRDVQLNSSRRVLSNVAGNIDSKSLHLSCNLSSTIESDSIRHAACGLSNAIKIESAQHVVCNLLSTIENDTNRHPTCDFPTDVAFDFNPHVAFDFLTNIEHDLGDLLHPKDPTTQRLAEFECYRGRVVTAVYMNKPTRYIVTDIAYDMTPLSPFPDPEVAPTFFDYFKQRYGLEVRGDQPLLHVKCLRRVTNALVSKYRDSKGQERPLPDKESKRRKKSSILLIPELCSIHPVPLSIWQDAMVLPTILYRLEAILLADELRQTIALQAGVGDVNWPDDVELPLLSLGESVGECMEQQPPSSVNLSEVYIQTSTSSQPSSTLLLKALTCASAMDVFNHDRLELYGDSFIKFAVSLNIFCKSPCLNVGQLSFHRGLAISNRQLLYLGRAVDIPSYCINQKFQPLNNWCPHGFTRIISNMPQECRLKLQPVSNEVDSSDNDDDIEPDVSPSDVKSTLESTIEIDAYSHVVLSDKSVADTTEAILGAYLVAGGDKSALNVMKWLGYNVPDYFDSEYVASFMKQAGYTNPTNQNDFSSECVRLSSFLKQTEDVELTKTSHTSCTDADRIDYVILEEKQYNKECDREEGQSPVHSFNTSEYFYTISKSNASFIRGEVKGFESTSENPITSKPPMNITSRNNIERDRRLQDEFKDLETSLGYVFINKGLLHQALVHVTYPRDLSHLTSSYEQLEFLGDALLDYLVTRHLYFTHSNMNPGGLTDLRSAIVNSYSFAFLSVQHGFHRHLRSMSPAVFRTSNKFTSVLKESIEKKMVAQTDQLCSSVFVPPDDSDENSEGIEVPKVLADLFESVIAAVFLDCGMNVKTTWLVVYNLLKPTFDHYADHPPFSPVRQLKEMLPNNVCFSACELAITGRYNCSVHVTGYGKFKGTGRSPKIARSTAAQRALAHIEDRKQKH